MTVGSDIRAVELHRATFLHTRQAVLDLLRRHGVSAADAAEAAGAELADELDQLDETENELLKKSLDDIIRDTPQAQIGALRFKRLVGKAGGGSIELFKEVLKGAVSETTVRVLFAQAGVR